MTMAEINGQYYSQDIVFKETTQFNSGIFNSGTVIYEVIRVFNSTALFIEDHLARLQRSVTLAGYSYSVSIPVMHYILRNLIRKNNVSNGNIKIVLHFDDQKHPVLYSFFIPHAYPDMHMYEKGVGTDFFHAARVNPNIKRLNPDMAEKVSEFIKKGNLYDALLLSEEGLITEGSKTNVFFVRGDSVITAPADMVLRGITREKVIELCKSLDIPVIEMPIDSKTVGNYDAAFFTGTSPKVLPIHSMATHKFSTKNAVMRSIMKGYDDLITAYIFHW
jgi:branched-chain amino acid aminotransferase